MEFPWVRLALAQVILALILLSGGTAGASDSWASYERHWSAKSEPQQIAATWPISEVKQERSSPLVHEQRGRGSAPQVAAAADFQVALSGWGACQPPPVHLRSGLAPPYRPCAAPPTGPPHI